MIVKRGIYFFIAISVIACKKKVDYYHLPMLSSNKIYQAVIEIPAGTNKKVEYSKDLKTFELDQKNGEDRIVQFLPYIENYGYIPSTYSNPHTGGDGDALDVLVLSESMPTRALIEIIPIAILNLVDASEKDSKIIAIPADDYLQISKANTYDDLEKSR